VAPQGTALTTSQLRLLKRYTKRVMLVLDQDAAGQKATLRSIKLCLEEEIEVKVVVMSGKDPDEVVRKSPDQAKSDLTRATGYYEYLRDLGNRRFSGNKEYYPARMSDFLLPFIGLVQHNVHQESLLRDLSADLKVSFESLQEELTRIDQSQPVSNQELGEKQVKVERKITRLERLWRGLTALMLQTPALVETGDLNHLLAAVDGYQGDEGWCPVRAESCSLVA